MCAGRRYNPVMTPDLYLIAPPDIDAATLAEKLRPALLRPGIAALLLPRGDRDETAYHALVRKIAPAAQEANAAVLIEGEPQWVQQLGVDGLHTTGGIGAVRAALDVLKPDHIVGVGDVRSRHDAMQKAEAGVDYILFGPLSGRIDDAQRELATWWSETMEIPCVVSDPDALPVETDTWEFAGVGLDTLEQTA